MKKITEESDSSENSDDDFVTKSIAHMRIKKLQDIRQPKNHFYFIQPKKNRTRQGYQLESTTPGADNADLFIENIADLNSAARDQHVFTAAQTVAFVTDQVMYFRITCGVAAPVISDDAIHEIAYFRLLAYKHRLANSQLVLADHHVQYNNCKGSDPNMENSIANILQNHQDWDQHEARVIAWTNANRLEKQHFSNYVCLLAYVFRQKGHHYVDTQDYEDTSSECG